MTVITVMEQLEKMGFIRRSSYDAGNGPRSYWGIMAIAYFFRFEEGGFISLHNTERNKNRLYIAKMAANIANAVAIISITFMGVRYQWRDKKIEKENDRLEKKVENSQKKIIADQKQIKRLELQNKNLGKKIIDLETQILKNSDKGDKK